MREIEYRAWDKLNEKMVKVNRIDFDKKEIDVIIEKTDSTEKFYSCSFDEIELLEYIGIKDIHQKKIYEGDIIQFVWDDDSCWGKAGTYRGYIRFNEGVFEVVYIDREKITTDSDGYWHENSESDDVQSLFSWSEEIEVIGNIYENPEMAVII